MFKDEFKAVVNGGVGKIKLSEEQSSWIFCCGNGCRYVYFFRKLCGLYSGAVINAGDAASWTKPAQAFALPQH